MLPDTVQEIIIAADSDPAGQKAALAAAERFTREGHKVRIATPPQNQKDFNALKQKDLII
jgi:DNA primase